jgi:hypothetical protein
MTMRRAALLYALAAMIPVPASLAGVGTPCTADVRLTAKSDQTFSDHITKVWAAEADVQQTCAKLTVDLKVTERLFDGEEITSTHRGERKVNGGGTATYGVYYNIAPDSTLTDWSYKVVRCVVCGTD